MSHNHIIDKKNTSYLLVLQPYTRLDLFTETLLIYCLILRPKISIKFDPIVFLFVSGSPRRKDKVWVVAS